VVISSLRAAWRSSNKDLTQSAQGKAEETEKGNGESAARLEW